jgi:hypothetical protein
LQKIIFKDGRFGPLEVEQILLALFGVAAIFARNLYYEAGPIGQVIILVVFLGLLIGVAPIKAPASKSRFKTVVLNGFLSGILDSFIVLMKARDIRTRVYANIEVGETGYGVRAQFLTLITLAALIGGLVIWFGEVYAAGLYNNNQRTGLLSALYIVPPVTVFLGMLGWHASRLPIEVLPAETRIGGREATRRDLLEFMVGIGLLLITHNPMLCLGVLIVYAVLTGQSEYLLDSWKHETEVNVMLVLLIALVAGSWLVTQVINPLGLGTGLWALIPSGIQSVLWGPLYDDPLANFWFMITVLSTGAMLTPISSLVGVMLFKDLKQWMIYMRYSIPYAALWFSLMNAWIWLTQQEFPAVGQFLDQWAIVGSH